VGFRKVTSDQLVALGKAWRDYPHEPGEVSRLTGVSRNTARRYRPSDLPPLERHPFSREQEVSVKRAPPEMVEETAHQAKLARAEARPEPAEKVLAPESTIDAPDAEEKQEGRMLAIGRINATNLSAGAAVVSGLMKKSTHSLHKRVDEIDDPHELVDIIYKLAKTSRELATASKCLIEASRLRRGEINPLVNINVEHNKTLEVGSALQALEDVAHVYELAKRRKVAALEQSIDVTIDAHKSGTGDAS